MNEIVVDAMGGDHAPDCNIDGAIYSLSENNKIKVILVGREEQIKKYIDDSIFLKLYKKHFNRLEIVPATEIVAMADKPVEGIRQKKDNSIIVGLNLIKDRSNRAFISAGNTGAVMTGAVLTLGRIKGVSRPAIVSLLPTLTGHTIIVDAGANIECTPKYLEQFGVMGTVYSNQIIGIKEPIVAVLSNGSEESKGTELTKAAYKLLQKHSCINFSGYIEGKQVLSGDADVIVTDGFTGNILLKSVEGVGEFFSKNLRAIFKESIITGLAALLVRPAFRRLYNKIDYAAYGGAPLLGLKGRVFIAHGSSSARAIKNAILVADRFINKRVNSLIEERINA